MWNAAREFHDFNATLDIAAGVRNRLSMFRRKQFRQAVEFLLNQLEKLEHNAGATLWIGRCPTGLSSLSVRDGVLDLGVLGERDPGLDLADIGIEDVAETPGCSLDDLATNEMADFTHGTHSSAFLKGSGQPVSGIWRRFVAIFAVFRPPVTSWWRFADLFSFTNG